MKPTKFPPFNKYLIMVQNDMHESKANIWLVECKWITFTHFSSLLNIIISICPMMRNSMFCKNPISTTWYPSPLSTHTAIFKFGGLFQTLELLSTSKINLWSSVQIIAENKPQQIQIIIWSGNAYDTQAAYFSYIITRGPWTATSALIKTKEKNKHLYMQNAIGVGLVQFYGNTHSM